jgi:TonB-linked SusC/RagA family outer membrane protein
MYSPNVIAAKTFSLSPAVQQSKTVTGQVTDAAGALIGATIKEKGSTNGVVTDLDGNFTINVKPGSVLIVSYIGYKTKEITVGNKSHLDITLEQEGHSLSDVVVIGYGTQRREAVTGSVANVKGDVLNEVAAPDAAKALQGRVAGVLMTQTSSQPGAEMQIRIRGQRSLNASNDPLIVLDGIPFMGSLSDINPADIKSMDILKDASATAIYGSRGANGVIIITSVKGSMESPATVSYNAYVGFQKVFHKYPMMNGKQFSQLRKDAGLYQNTVDESDDVNTDWQDLFFKTGITTNHDLSVTGGTKGGSYSFGGGYYHNGGVVPTQGFTRISLHGNFDQMVGKWFRFGLTTNNNYRETSGTQISLYNVLSMSPLATPYDSNGNLKRTINMPVDNMYVQTKDVVENLKDEWLDDNKGLGSYNTVFAEIKCPWVDGLKYRVNVGLNYRNSKEGVFTGTGVNSTTATTPNTASVQQDVTRNWAVENIITYDKTFAKKHQINITGLYSAEQTTFERTYMSGKSIPAEYFQYYNIGAADGEIAVDPNNQDYWQSGLESWMGRFMYSYDNKYMISAALRADASSRLAKGHQWHTYPAISAGWNLERESFMKKFTWIDNLKLRVGYGETSNQSISPYSTLGALSIRPYNFGPTNTGYARGYYVSTLPNEDLGWEYSSTWNFGLDYSFLGGRINGTFEYYIQNTKDLLLGVALPATIWCKQLYCQYR